MWGSGYRHSLPAAYTKFSALFRSKSAVKKIICPRHIPQAAKTRSARQMSAIRSVWAFSVVSALRRSASLPPPGPPSRRKRPPGPRHRKVRSTSFPPAAKNPFAPLLFLSKSNPLRGSDLGPPAAAFLSMLRGLALALMPCSAVPPPLWRPSRRKRPPGPGRG